MRIFRTATLAVSMLTVFAGCASQAPMAGRATETARAALACTLPSNCVDSVGDSGMQPLRYTGTPAQAMAALQATVKVLDARVVREGPLQLQTVFTTSAGFTDEVDFLIDPQSRRIDFRSRSVFGLFDFGKNRSRMQEFTSRYAQQPQP